MGQQEQTVLFFVVVEILSYGRGAIMYQNVRNALLRLKKSGSYEYQI